MALKGGTSANIASLKRQLKKGGNDDIFKIRDAETVYTVRFMTEPDQWFGYYEHYTDEFRYFPCSGEPSCPGCETQDRKPSHRFLAPAILVEEGNKVVPMQLTKSVVSAIVRRYDKDSTITNRDWEISKSGTGLDTEYVVDPMPVRAVRMDRYEAPDLELILENQLPPDSAPEDRDDEPVRSRRTADVDDEDQNDNNVMAQPVEEGEEDGPTGQVAMDEEGIRENFRGVSLAAAKIKAKSFYGVSKEDLVGLDIADIVDLVVEVAQENVDKMNAPAKAKGEYIEDLESTDGGAGTEGGDAAPADKTYSSAELREMSVGELTPIAKALDITVRVNANPGTLVAKIIEAQNARDDTDEPPY